MSTQLIDFLSAGLHLWVEDGKLRFRAGWNDVNVTLEQRLECAKDELLQRLKAGHKYAPVSFDQERLWFLDQLVPSRSIFNVPMAYRLHGDLDVAALVRTLNDIVARHESLRTSFESMDSVPFQVVRPSMSLELPQVNLTGIAEGKRHVKLHELLHRQTTQPFDLDRTPLLRGLVVKMDAHEHVLALTIHHIVFDGWSEAVLLDELATIYKQHTAGGAPPATPVVQYADFVNWQRCTFQDESSEQHWSYWREQLAGPLPVLELPTDYPRPAVQKFAGATETLRIPNELVDGLQQTGKHVGTTLFMVLLAAFKTLLHRYTGQRDLLVGTPVVNLSRFEFQSVIGLLTNTVVLRTRLDENWTFVELLARVRATCLGAYGHQEMPFGQLVEKLQPTRDLSRTPLFQVMFGLNEIRHHARTLGNAVEIEKLHPEIEVAHSDLTLLTRRDEDGALFILKYDTRLFHSGTARQLLEHYRNLLEGIVADPNRSLHTMPILSESERHRILVEWNRTNAEYGTGVWSQLLFEHQAETSPHSTAADSAEGQVTYRELNQRSNQLAHHLVKLGVQPNALVGICLHRSLEMLVGLLAIHKAGGAYVPLDPDLPRERLAFMTEDAAVDVLLTEERLVSVLPKQSAKVVVIDTEAEAIARESVANPEVRVSAYDSAYVIYTSGSTGKPKGVQVRHAALTNFLQSMSQVLGISAKDRLLSVTTLSFDIAALELFLPLAVGASVHVVSRDVAADAFRLRDTLENSAITFMQATPATWYLLLEANWQGGPKLNALCGGEALSRDLAQELLKRTASLWNMYGPTETTIWSACSKVESGTGPVPIGRPIANTQLYVLDEHLQPVPVRVPGELCIGGQGLARGYLRRAKRTAEKFVVNSFAPGTRMFRTGDLARYNAAGEIEFLGRIDNQVKLRGFRIELGEIESILCEHPGVERAAVNIHGDTPEDKRLVAYFVCHPRQTVAHLHEFLKQKLPDYMVPSAFVKLDELPLTPNGKVDRKALPAPEGTVQEHAGRHEPSRTSTEEALVRTWCEVLKIDHVGVRDNFFEMGGHSLLALQLVNRVYSNHRVRLTLRSMFQHPTVAELARQIDVQRADGAANESPLAVEQDRV